MTGVQTCALPICRWDETFGVEIPVVVGGIIPPADVAPMKEAGVERVYTPKDFELNRIMGEIAELVAERSKVAAGG